MMLADTHVHTMFSPDGERDPDEFINYAINAGLKHLCFTEHVDLLYYMPQMAHCDIDAYFARVRALKQKYADKIYIGAGLEIGYTDFNRELNRDFIKKYNPDYVINSVHEVNGFDCYFNEYFNNKSAKQAASEYLNAVLCSVNAPYDYNTIGHIGYVVRNAPYNIDLLSGHRQEVEEILRAVIKKDKILEINTSIKREKGLTVPAPDIISLYVELGGKKLCFASDAHSPEFIGRSYNVAANVAQSLGIKNQCVIQDGKEIMLPF